MNIDKALNNIDYENIYSNKPRRRSLDPRQMNNTNKNTSSVKPINRHNSARHINHNRTPITNHSNDLQKRIADGLDIPTITEPQQTRNKMLSNNDKISKKKMNKKIKQMTQGYKEINKDEYNTIKAGTQIIYWSKRKQKELPKNVIVIKHGITKGKPGMKLCRKDIAVSKNNPFGGWWVQYRNIKKVWIEVCDLSLYNKIMVEDIIGFLNEKYGHEFQQFISDKYNENPKRYEPLTHFS